MNRRIKDALTDVAVIAGTLAAGALALYCVIEFMWACADAGIPM